MDISKNAVELRVELMEHSRNIVPLLYAICKQCNSPMDAADIFIREKAGYESELHDLEKFDIQPPKDGFTNKQVKLIRSVIASGHTSTVEHVCFTFGISGFSRISSQQVTRHRIGMAVTQQSQRETSGDNFHFVIPPNILLHEDTRTFFFKKMQFDMDAYEQMRLMLEAHGYKKQSCQEDARSLLPNACETKFVLTFNARALLHFIELRNCRKAQLEVRNLSNQILKLVTPIVPVIFDSAGAPCERHGFCTEDRSCGRYPSLNSLLSKE